MMVGMSSRAQQLASLRSADALARRLRSIPALSDLPEEALLWLAEHMEVAQYEPGEIITPEGSPADRMIVVLEGSINAKKELEQSDGRTYAAVSGQVSGMLPYSRLTRFPLTSRAMTPVLVAFLHTKDFPEMLREIPVLAPRLVSVMADRIRETTRADQQREKLMALGKLSAGIAHEMNNPASAISSGSVSLREAIQHLRDAHHHLDTKALSIEDRVYIAELECDSSESAPAALNTLERSDREELLGSWLAGRGIQDPWRLASSLVESGCKMEALIDIASRFDNETLCAVLTRLTAWSTVDRLLHQLENGAHRIFSLVSAIRDYSYMDQGPEQELDVQEGIENTLLMRRYRLQDGISIAREYDSSAPKVSGNGAELNQVWTNLIDNAIDAMRGRGELGVRTVSEYKRVLVEIRDTGPGIAPDIRDRIFEPFFTTKQVGEGTGLGLDIVYRIVRKHRGEIHVDSQPGRTSFQVRIPAAQTVTPAF